MEHLDRAADIQQIFSLKARYCRYTDEKNFEGFVNLFTEDAEVDVRDALKTSAVYDGLDMFSQNGNMIGREAIARFSFGQPEGIDTVHHLFVPEIDFAGDVANCIWPMEDIITDRHARAFSQVHGYGHYHDRYVRQNGDWRIQSVRLTRLRVEIR